MVLLIKGHLVSLSFQSGVSLEVRDLSVSLTKGGSESTIIEKLSFQVGPGEIVAICGQSGIGKSTLVLTIAGLIPPKQGQVLIDSTIVSEPIENLGFVTQDYSRSLFPWLTVEKNVALPFKGKKLSKEERKTRVQEALNEVGLADASRLYPWQLSGGMQQRVALARALVVKPKLLILDEPFASLDVYVRLELEDLVVNLVRTHGTTTLLVTHDIDEAIYMGDRALVLAGSPAKLGSDLLIDLQRPRVQMETRSNPIFLQLRNQLHASIRS
jgi:NitT/TauT family transport system ATP-binding protein